MFVLRSQEINNDNKLHESRHLYLCRDKSQIIDYYRMDGQCLLRNYTCCFMLFREVNMKISKMLWTKFDLICMLDLLLLRGGRTEVQRVGA